VNAVIPYFISGGGFAGLIAFCFMTGWIHSGKTCGDKDKQIAEKNEEIKEYKAALELERARSDANVHAAAIVKDVMDALRKEA
jgi:hypothetical protein